jgi:ribonuclease HI
VRTNQSVEPETDFARDCMMLTLAPWEKRVQTITDESASTQLDARWGARIAVSSSARNSVIGMGGAIEIHKSARNNPRNEILSFSSTLGTREEQNPHSRELAAMANSLNALPKLRFRSIVLTTRNKAALLTLKKPRQQSRQEHISRIYRFIRTLKRDRNTIIISWLPSSESNELIKLAKEKAKTATRQGSTPETQLPRMRSTTLNITRAKCNTTKGLPKNVGIFSRRINAALPGKHTRQLYNRLS